MATLAQRTSRGVFVHLVASASLYALYAAQSVVVARWVTPLELGLFALSLGAVSLVQQLKRFGVAEKFVQDRGLPQAETFATAFTLELVLTVVSLPLLAAVVGFFVWWYGQPRLIPVSAVLAFTLLEGAASLPAQIFARELRFVRQRTLQFGGSLVGVVTTIVTAISGFGVWALVAGRVASIVATGAILWGAARARPHLRWVGRDFRRYVSFGAPLWGASFLSLLGEQGAEFAISTAFGLDTLGYYYFAERLSQRLTELNSAMNTAMYPALIQVQDSEAKLRRAFDESNRLLLVWAMPLGFGIAVFAPDLVPLVFGAQWRPAVPLVQIWCLYNAANAIGYNWNLFFEVRGNSRPRLVYAVAGSALTLGTLVPAIFLFGVRGIVGSMVVGMVVALGLRQRFLRQLFPGVSLLGTARNALATALLATASASVVGLVIHDEPRRLLVAGSAFLLTTLAATFSLERQALAVAVAQLRGTRP